MRLRVNFQLLKIDVDCSFRFDLLSPSSALGYIYATTSTTHLCNELEILKSDVLSMLKVVSSTMLIFNNVCSKLTSCSKTLNIWNNIWVLLLYYCVLNALWVKKKKRLWIVPNRLCLKLFSPLWCDYELSFVKISNKFCWKIPLMFCRSWEERTAASIQERRQESWEPSHMQTDEN